MGSPSSGNNVVSLGDHPRAKARLTPQESATVLGGCRDLALDRLSRSLTGMLDRVEEELFTLAASATDRDAQNVFLDARSHARAKRPMMEASFRRHFAECFNSKVRGDKARGAPEGGELTLVAPDALEESLAVSEMSRRLKAACEDELLTLGQRMGYLLERPELEDDANPLSPGVVCDALRDACGQVGGDSRVRLVLLRQLERHAVAEVHRIYHEVNEHLVQHRILPDARPVAVKRATAARAAIAKPAEPKAAATPVTTPTPANPADLFGTLTQLLGQALPGGAGAGPGGGVGTGFAGGSGAAGAATPLVETLTRLHREAPAAQGDGLVNQVREFKSSPHAANLATVDALTIDIVAMLFDFVFEDRQIPDSVKALLGRLQIPVLKVALLDKSFFSSKSHPARQLIDGLAEASIGLDEAHERGAATLALVEEVVDRVLADFDTDLELFDKLVERVRAFIAENHAAEQAIITHSASVIEARERQDVAMETAEREVERRLASRLGVPPVVRGMLEDVWCAALADAWPVGGENAGPWRYLVQGMDDLLWSVEPKAAPDDRKRLVAMLPGLLRTLQDGFTRAKRPEADRNAFLASLVDCHAGAVKAGLKGIMPMPEVVIPPVPEAPRIEREVLPAGKVQVEQIRLKTSRGGTVRNVFTRTGIWTNVQRGTWVEFARAAGDATRARLTWISPNKGVYLFTNPAAGAAAISISPEALAEQMRLGEARILDDGPLVERAVGSMLATLRNDADSGARVA
jgi:hypothetical protein